MNPIPCKYCGVNFMRHNLHPETPKLCNNCSHREKIKKGQVKMKTDTVAIIIQCPTDIQKEIEEICLNEGCNFSDYFLNLYHNRISQNPTSTKTKRKKDEATA